MRLGLGLSIGGQSSRSGTLPPPITNGTFDTDLSGWTNTTGWWEWAAPGRAYHPPGNIFRDLTQTVDIEGTGDLTYDLEVISGSISYYYFRADGSGPVVFTKGVGTFAISLSIGAGLSRVGFGRNTVAVGEFYVDNVVFTPD